MVSYIPVQGIQKTLKLEADYLSVPQGETTLKINKDKIKYVTWESAGIINLIYEDDSCNIKSVELDLDKNSESFAQAGAYILDSAYSDYQTEFTGIEELKKTYPDFTDEDIEVFKKFFVVKIRRAELYQRLADA